MTDPVTLFCDFDGVINTFPDAKHLRRGGFSDVVKTWRDHDPRKPLYAPDHAYKPEVRMRVMVEGHGRIPLRWSSELMDEIRGIITDERVDFTWLSTWQEFIEPVLYDALEIRDLADKMDIAVWKRFSMDYPDLVKRQYVERWLTTDMATMQQDNTLHKTFIWIDDEVASEASRGHMLADKRPDYMIHEENIHGLMIRPNDEIGISRPQMQRIREFIENPSDGITVMDEAWTGFSIYDHVGL
jgi:hypothetical protein